MHAAAIITSYRAKRCRRCPTPCRLQYDQAAHAEPCSVCPVGRWSRGPHCGEAPTPPPAMPLGDRLEAEIAARILAPVRASGAVGAQIVEAIENCGGCGHAKRALGSRDAGEIRPII